MRKIIVLEFITLDGVMQAPVGLKRIRQVVLNLEVGLLLMVTEVSGKLMKKQMEPADLLLGRKTFEIFANFWPEHKEVWPGIIDVNKYVLSNTIKDSDPVVSRWKNSNVLTSLAAIQKLKNSNGSDIKVWGSSKLVQLLLANDLVDELLLKIYPLTLGKGKKLFDNGTIPAAFTLTESTVTPGWSYFC
jgi:dihydrofolate reductase